MQKIVCIIFNRLPVASKILAILCLFFCVSSSYAKEILVVNKAEFNEAVQSLVAGDTIVMANGIWKDFEMVFEGKGTKQKPIKLRAQERGKVIISGMSNLRLAGEYLEVSGLVFKNGYTPTSTVISFRKSKEQGGNPSDYIAFNSRLTEVVIDNFSNPERFETDFWVLMYGKHNRVDHNHFSGKHNKGVLLAVKLDSKNSQQNYHKIDHNYFGPRSILGANGGETIRVGTSHYSLSNSFTRIESNYFDRCDGELEIISIKSGNNLIKNNVFFESRGTLTLRHGNDNIIEDNIFLGNGVDHTGGIRVINKGQIVRNNYLNALTGYRFGGALVVMNGVPNSPINRYHQVDGAIIENNSIINSHHIQLAAGSDKERSAVPINSRFKNNLIYNDSKQDIFTVYDDISGVKFEDNLVHKVNKAELKKGFNFKSVKLDKDSTNNLLYPSQKRFSNIGVKRNLKPIRKNDTGVSWYSKEGSIAAFDSRDETTVKPGLDTLTNAFQQASSGDTLVLAPGNYVVSKTLKVDKTITIKAEKTRSTNIEYTRKTLFEIKEGGNLKLNGVDVSGSRTPDDIGNSVIRTHRYSMLSNYTILIENSNFRKLNVNHSFNFIDVAKSTMADRIDIINSEFTDITGAILKLDKEVDDYGIYNAEYVSIVKSKFKNIDKSLVDYYRGGTDESTFGPHFFIKESILENVGKGKRNKSAASIFLHGVQVSTINNNKIENSAPIKVFHTVGEPVTKIFNNTFTNTPDVFVQELYSRKENTALIYDNTQAGVTR